MKKNYEKDLPKIESIEDKYSNKIFFIAFGIIYFIFYSAIGRFLVGKIPGINNLSNNALIALNIIPMIAIYVVLFVLFNERFKRDIKILFKNFKVYFKYEIHVLLRYYWIYILSNICIASLFMFLGKNPQSSNEAALDTFPIWATAIMAILIAPVTEEGVFRWIMRKITDKKWAFIFLSGIIFGLIHINYWGEQDWIQVVFIVPYSIMGMMLAESYYKTNNLFASSLLHATINLLAVLIRLLLPV